MEVRIRTREVEDGGVLSSPSWASWKEEEEEGGLARPCMAHLGINPQLQSVATDFILHRFSSTGPWSPRHHDTDLRFHSTSFLVVCICVWSG